MFSYLDVGNVGKNMNVKLAALIVVNNPEPWLDICLSCLTSSDIDIIIIAASEVPWVKYNQKAREIYSSTCVTDNLEAKYNKHGIIRFYGEWDSDEDQRNAALDIIKQTDATHFLIVDSDEFFHSNEIAKLKEWLVERKEDTFEICCRHFFKELCYEIVFGGRFARLELSRKRCFKVNDRIFIDKSKMSEMENAIVCPPGIMTCYHAGWVFENDEQCKRKLETWSHAHQVIDGWFDNVWLKWKLSDANFHMIWSEAFLHVNVVHPHCFPKCTWNNDISCRALEIFDES